MKNKIPVFMETIRVLKNTANVYIQTERIQDCIAFGYFCFYVVLFYFTAVNLILIPLLIIWKPRLGIVYLLYLCWVYYDRNTPRMGGRKSKWFCNMFFFDALRHYFSNRLIKTADLPEGRNYILAHYPHAVLPMNLWPNFMSNCNKVADLFPGIEMQYTSLEAFYLLPLMREFLLATGGCSCSESSLTYLLNRPHSNGIIVTPGGAPEILYSQPGSIYKIIKRKGFVRIALTTGSPLVPVFTFGEINIWTKVIRIPLFKPIEKMLRSAFRTPPDVFITLGRGLFPKKIPVNTIVGAPISVPKVENPSKEVIDKYCDKFYQALQDIFEQYKGKYDLAGEKAELIMTSDPYKN